MKIYLSFYWQKLAPIIFWPLELYKLSFDGDDLPQKTYILKELSGIPLFTFLQYALCRNKKYHAFCYLYKGYSDLVVYHKDPNLFVVSAAGGCDSMGVSEDSEGLLSSTEPSSVRWDGGTAYGDLGWASLDLLPSHTLHTLRTS